MAQASLVNPNKVGKGVNNIRKYDKYYDFAHSTLISSRAILLSTYTKSIKHMFFSFPFSPYPFPYLN